jgi:A/G-specific adenine glycosylase
MMELGAVVCTPRAPACLTCPLIEPCATRGELAATEKPPPQKKREIHYALHYRNGDGRDREVFLVQRARAESLMAGMWELPGLPGMNGGVAPLFTVRHSITTTDYTVRVWCGAQQSNLDGKWIPVERLPKIALTGLTRKILSRADLL